MENKFRIKKLKTVENFGQMIPLMELTHFACSAVIPVRSFMFFVIYFKLLSSSQKRRYKVYCSTFPGLEK